MTARDSEQEPDPASASAPSSARENASGAGASGAAVPAPEPFERAKWPMLIATVGVAAGLAVAGSASRTAGGAIVLGAWVLGVGALHRLGRAGSTPRPGDEP